VFSELDPQPGHLSEASVPFVSVKDPAATAAAIADFDPALIHSHWMTQLPRLHRVAKQLGLPYTMRAHSFDVIPTPYMKRWFNAAPRVVPEVAASELFLGVLSFPFGRPILEQWGLSAEQITDCYPVAHLDLFRDRSPNGKGVMNTGACTPKKKIGDYLLLARMCEGMNFDYYPVAYRTEQIRQRNQQLGSPVTIHDLLPHRAMPAEYKKHDWMVYTADKMLKNVGWPMAVAEAQAAGVGVVMANIRPDLAGYVGEAGYLFDNPEEARDIIRQPFPDEKRELGFELAERSDARKSLHLLTDLWKPVLERAA
jgi:glycosyltransferase involved in cell wall biosynthesis